MGKASRAKRGGPTYAWESQQHKQRRKEEIERHNQAVEANSAKATRRPVLWMGQSNANPAMGWPCSPCNWLPAW